MELVFSINYRVLSTINFFSTKDHSRFVGDEAFNKAKLCVRSYVIGLFIRIRRSHWLIKITGTCKPIQLPRRFFVACVNRDSERISNFAGSEAKFEFFRVLCLHNSEASVITLCGNF